MSIWMLIQIAFDIFVMIGLLAAWLRLRRPPQDDPRLSRGLQLLQTKITVLEDLSDRTDAQVKQLTGLLDQKARIVQNKILEAENQVLKIDHSMSKSLEVAEIFQDKIPHEEILERQRTVEYVKAARLAHSGASVDEIVNAVQLPREQVELIAKFNRDQLMFDESQLPHWADREHAQPMIGRASPLEGGAPGDPDAGFTLKNMDFMNNLEPRKPEISEIEKQFKEAVHAAKVAAENPPPTLMDNPVIDAMAATVESMQPAVASLKATANTLKDKLVTTAEDFLKHAQTAPPTVKKVEDTPKAFTLRQSPVVQGGDVKKVIFPRIDK